MIKRREYEGLESSIRSALMGKSAAASPDPLQLRDAFKVPYPEDKLPLNPRWRNPFYSRPIVVAILSTIAILGMAGGAVAVDNFPGPTRAIAYELHLPVSSPALVAAKNAETQLRVSLERGDRRSEVKAGMLELRIRLHTLDSADLHSIYQDANSLLHAAQEYLDRSEPTATSETTQPSEPTATTETTQPSEPTATTETTQPSEPTATTETTQPSEPTATTETTQPNKQIDNMRLLGERSIRGS